MIDPGLFIAFAAAVAILMLTPGPNVALIVGNSVAFGRRYGLLTVAGTSSAMAAQIALTAFGMAELLEGASHWFEAIRWIGVAYLVYLGVVQWRAPIPDLSEAAVRAASRRKIFGRALIVALTNPKVLFFLGAFFPQFVDPNRAIGPQTAILSATFLAIVCVVDTGWALTAGRARRLLAGRARAQNRISGALLIAAGIGLALARNR
ncbi:MAG: LysE family translocator [Rhodospirillales bacterium]|nr:LysE family translocator [Rhodospirillales bacterium]